MATYQLLPCSTICFDSQNLCWVFHLLETSNPLTKIHIRLSKAGVHMFSPHLDIDRKLQESIASSSAFLLALEKIKEAEEKMKQTVFVTEVEYIGKDHYNDHFVKFSLLKERMLYLGYCVGENNDCTLSHHEKPSSLDHQDYPDYIISFLQKETFVYDEHFSICEIERVLNLNVDQIPYVINNSVKPLSFAPYLTFDKDVAAIILNSPSVRIRLLTN